MSELQSPAPWEQQRDEPNRAFEHFLYYLYSPRPRKLATAYKAMNPDATDVGSTWKRESKIWEWEERAHHFDVCNITRQGQEVVVNMVGAMRLLSYRIMESLSTQRGEVWTYEQTITALRLFADLVPAETVAALRTTAGSDSVPAIGSRPVAVGAFVANFAAIAPGSMGNSPTHGEDQSNLQWPALGEDGHGRGAGGSGRVTRGEDTVDGPDV